MKKMTKWGFMLLLVLAMVFAFAVGCAPAEEIEDDEIGGVGDELDEDELYLEDEQLEEDEVNEESSY